MTGKRKTRTAILGMVAIVLGLMVPLTDRAEDTAAEKVRARAWDALRARLHEKKYLNHSLGVEAMMREMADPKTDDRDEWALAGLLHDIDITETAGTSNHGVAGGRIVRGLGFGEAVAHAVSSHDDSAGIARTSRLDHGLYCADQLYWLMASSGVKFPSAELPSQTPASVLKQMQALPEKKTAFDKTSKECGQIGLTMPRAIELALAGLRKVHVTEVIR